LYLPQTEIETNLSLACTVTALEITRKGEMTMPKNNKSQLVLVTSLPQVGGPELREGLEKLAEQNDRSVSNQTYVLLKNALAEEGVL